MKSCFVACFLLVVANNALWASPLHLDYSVTPVGGGLNQYDFTLTLDNHDASWAAGQGFGWLIFGDVQSSTSPLADFAMGSPFPVGPWTTLGTSTGLHNGPTFQYALDYWVPGAVGDSLSWSGTSASDVLQGDLLFTTNSTINNGVGADFQVANRLGASPPTTEIPEPASLALWTLLGAAGLTAWRRRFRARQASSLTASASGTS